jgi:hypothetical protein
MPRKVRRGAAPKNPVTAHAPRDEIPDICEACGQRIDKNSRASIDHHSTPKHLPYAGQKAQRAWRR